MGIHPKGITYAVGVQPKGYETAWIGAFESEFINPSNSVENEDTRFGANPAFDPSESGSLSPSGRIEWLSANPTLLLITLYDYPQGNGHWSRRIDKLVRYAETHPQVLLDDSLQVYGQWGWNSFLHLYAQRRIHARTINGKLEITFHDACRHLDASEIGTAPLHRRRPSELTHKERSDLAPDKPFWCGCIEIDRKRIWRFDGRGLGQTADVVRYRVQPGDTRAEIAGFFYKHMTAKDCLSDRSVKAKRWLTLPNNPDLRIWYGSRKE